MTDASMRANQTVQRQIAKQTKPQPETSCPALDQSLECPIQINICAYVCHVLLPQCARSS